jgi:hypothetical protein
MRISGPDRKSSLPVDWMRNEYAQREYQHYAKKEKEHREVLCEYAPLHSGWQSLEFHCDLSGN